MTLRSRPSREDLQLERMHRQAPVTFVEQEAFLLWLINAVKAKDSLRGPLWDYAFRKMPSWARYVTASDNRLHFMMFGRPIYRGP